MALDDQDPEISEAALATALAERGLDCAPADRQGILAVARFLQQAAARVRRFESEAEAAKQIPRDGSEAEAAKQIRRDGSAAEAAKQIRRDGSEVDEAGS